MWIVKHYGKASYCYVNPMHKGKRFEWANISGAYKREISDYKPMCPSCHRKMDMKNRCRKGHEYTEKNTLINCRGHRRCLICKKETKSAKVN